MRRYQKKGRVRARWALLWVFATGGCLVSSSLAQDFDFYAMDLIAQESFRKVSMDFRDASLKDVLKIFSEQSGLNFIASETIEDRTVTLFLDEVPLNDALKNIMSANNLTYDMEAGSNIFIVKETGLPSMELETRVFPLRFARLDSSNLQKSIDAGQESASSLSEEGEESGGGEEAGGAEASGVELTVSNVLTGRGSLVADKRTNTLIITDVPAQFEVIEKIIAYLDQPTPQVVIEVEMLDVAKRVIDEMGVDTTASILSLQGSAVDTRFPNFMADGIPILTNGITGIEGAPGVPGFQYGTLSANVFTAVLELLSSHTSSKFLARPRILTMSNETAEIKIATQEAIGQNTIRDSRNATETVQAERFETGVKLRVTPQVDMESGNVTMFIEPTVVESRVGATFDGTTYRDPEVRSTVATLMVKSGETIVVGGLIRNRAEKVLKKIPVLGDLPLIGMMFRHKDESVEERELLVFITPRIVTNRVTGELDMARHPFPSDYTVPFREQATVVSRKREVDSYLERWEN